MATLLLLALAAALPEPTGTLAVGRVTLEWTDRSRVEPLSPDHSFRTLMVDVWYPAETSQGPRAPYLDVPAFERAIGTAGLRRQVQGAYDAVRDGRVRTHAVAGAPFSRRVTRAPVLIFSPGGGLVREIYASQLENLASHGFVVAAMTHPYDGIVAVYSDGHAIAYDAKRWPAIPSLEGEWNLNQLNWHALDIRFVLDELARADRTPASELPFASHLDLAHVGAFGHSFGGVAATKACQTDRRFSACLNEDGLVGKRPFDVNGGSWASHQRFMLIERAGEPGPLPDEALAQMNISRERAESLLAQLTRAHEAALQLAGGSYDVVLDRTRTSHDDFTDLPVLAAASTEESDARARVAEVIRSLTLAFFEWTLRGKRPSMLETEHPQAPIDAIRRFGRRP